MAFLSKAANGNSLKMKKKARKKISTSRRNLGV
jgi:hypothetical protein